MSSTTSDSTSDISSFDSETSSVEQFSDSDTMFQFDDIPSVKRERKAQKYNKFLALLSHLQEQYDVTCDELKENFSYPPFNLGVRSQCKFLVANYPNVKWNIEPVTYDLHEIIRSSLEVIDIHLMRSVTFPFLCEAKRKGEQGKLQQIYNYLVLTIIECGDCIDMINTERVNTSQLPLVEKGSSSLLDLRVLFQHFYALHERIRNE